MNKQAETNLWKKWLLTLIGSLISAIILAMLIGMFTFFKEDIVQNASDIKLNSTRYTKINYSIAEIITRQQYMIKQLERIIQKLYPLTLSKYATLLAKD